MRIKPLFNICICLITGLVSVSCSSLSSSSKKASRAFAGTEVTSCKTLLGEFVDFNDEYQQQAYEFLVRKEIISKKDDSALDVVNTITSEIDLARLIISVNDLGLRGQKLKDAFKATAAVNSRKEENTIIVTPFWVPKKQLPSYVDVSTSRDILGESDQPKGLIGEYAFRNDIERSKNPVVEEFFLKMKNDPNFSHYVFTRYKKGDKAVGKLPKDKITKLLQEYPGFTEDDPMPAIINFDNPGQLLERFNYKNMDIMGSFLGFFIDITNYERLILGIRSGDFLKDKDGNAFELGQFLGAGNATQVFSLAQDHTKVARVALYSTQVRHDAFAAGSDISSIGRFNYLFVKQIEKYRIIPDLIVPQVHASSKHYEFIVVDRFSNFKTGDKVLGMFDSLKHKQDRSPVEDLLLVKIEKNFDKMKKLAIDLATTSEDPDRISAVNNADPARQLTAISVELRQVGIDLDEEPVKYYLLDIE